MNNVKLEISNSDPNKKSDFELLGNNYLWLGHMNTSYLGTGFNCRFLHVENNLFIHYNCMAYKKNCWTAKKGIFTMPFEDFLNVIELILIDFFNDMNRQVSEAINFLKNDEYSYTNPEGVPEKSGSEYLIEENENRKKELFKILIEVKEKSKVNESNWNEVRGKLTIINC